MPLMDKDSLLGLMKRETVLMFGKPSSGKSYAVIRLIEELLRAGRQAVVIDRGNGLAKAMREIWGTNSADIPDNFEYVLVKEWDDIVFGMTLAKQNLGPGDWLIFEEAGKMWDLAQTEYSNHVYDKSKVMHSLDLRAKAEQMVAAQFDENDPDLTDKEREAIKRIRKAETGFGGFSGDQWAWIKELHNDDVFDEACINSTYNVLSTTSASDLGDYDKNKPLYQDYLFLDAKPTGEKFHSHRHGSTLFTYQDGGGKFVWRTDLGGGAGKDRGYPLVKDQLCDEIGAIVGWLAHHAEHDGKA